MAALSHAGLGHPCCTGHTCFGTASGGRGPALWPLLCWKLQQCGLGSVCVLAAHCLLAHWGHLSSHRLHGTGEHPQTAAA